MSPAENAEPILAFIYSKMSNVQTERPARRGIVVLDSLRSSFPRFNVYMYSLTLEHTILCICTFMYFPCVTV